MKIPLSTFLTCNWCLHLTQEDSPWVFILWYYIHSFYQAADSFSITFYILLGFHIVENPKSSLSSWSQYSAGIQEQRGFCCCCWLFKTQRVLTVKSKYTNAGKSETRRNVNFYYIVLTRTYLWNITYFLLLNFLLWLAWSHIWASEKATLHPLIHPLSWLYGVLFEIKKCPCHFPDQKSQWVIHTYRKEVILLSTIFTFLQHQTITVIIYCYID